jgi:hypothetical protein
MKTYPKGVRAGGLPKGNYSASLTQKNSSPVMSTGKFSISSSGVITSSNFNSNFRAVMDADKTIIVGIGVRETIAPHSTYIMIWVKKTNGSKKGMPWLPLLLGE